MSEAATEEQFLAIVQELVKAFCTALGTEYRPNTMAEAIVYTMAGLLVGTTRMTTDLEKRVESLEAKLAG